MDSPNFYDDADLAALGAAPEAAPTAPEATTPAGEEPVAQDQADSGTAQEQSPTLEQGGEEPNPEGPGDHAKAYQAYRQQIAELKAQQAQAYAEMQQYRDYFANLQAQQQQAQLAEQLEAYSDDPEAIASILQAKQQEFQQQAQAQQAQAALRMGSDFARATLPDFDQQIGKLYGLLGADVVDSLAMQQANGPLWAYQLAQNLRTPDEFQAAVEARAQALAAETLQRANPKAPTSSRGIGAIPSAAPNQVTHPAQDTVKALNFGPHNPAFDASYDALLRMAGG